MTSCEDLDYWPPLETLLRQIQHALGDSSPSNQTFEVFVATGRLLVRKIELGPLYHPDQGSGGKKEEVRRRNVVGTRPAQEASPEPLEPSAKLVRHFDG